MARSLILKELRFYRVFSWFYKTLFFLDLFTPTPILEPDVKVDGAIAGICGFYNFANTCYMNSGLQCLLATPTFVKYFTESFESSKDDTIALGLTAKFQV